MNIATKKEIETIKKANKTIKRLRKLKAETLGKHELSTDDELLLTEINLILYNFPSKSAARHATDKSLEEIKEHQLYQNIDKVKPLMLEKKELLQKEKLSKEEKERLAFLNRELSDLPFGFSVETINAHQTIEKLIEILKAEI